MRTLLDLLPRMRELGEREAIRDFDGFRTRRWSYRELSGKVGAVVGLLRGQGLGAGDRAVLWGANGRAWVAAFWGCVASGIEVVPLDFQSSPGRVAAITRASGARLLISDRAGAGDFGGTEILSFDAVLEAAPVEEFAVRPASPDSVVDILYTSGTTGEPRGVVHRHRNVCANLRPLAREIDRYIRWAAPFQPIRFLDLLPMSHVFGQSMGLFVPVLVRGAAVFSADLRPGAVIETIRRERVSVLVAVPRLVASIRSSVERRFPTPAPGPGARVLRRMWRHRDVHRAFGWKFWALLVGGAELDPALEDFWSRRGFLVVQGYGLTESSSVVAANHPFDRRAGALGQVLGGQEVRIAPDGEILVRGENVVTEYVGAKRTDTAVDSEGWLHTGDVGHLDAEGRLHYRGRKKDLIVIGEGLNVAPEDVEAVLNACEGVRESVVVGRPAEGGERVHAAVIPDYPDADVGKAVEEANQRLEPHEKIREWSLWGEEDFPRTPSSLKIRRQEVRRRISDADGEIPSPSGDALAELLGQLRGSPAELTDESRLVEDVGLSSLERVDLLSAIEDRYRIELDEERLTGIGTLGELRTWVEAERTSRPFTREPSRPAAARWQIRPRWARSRALSLLRRGLQDLAFVPLFRRYISLGIGGLENLIELDPPVIFIANHASQLDTMALLAALPRSWRRLVSPAMSQEYFGAYLGPKPGDWSGRMNMRAQFLAAVALFNAYPLPHSMGNIRDSLGYTADLVDAGYCPLVYPEGERSPDGRLQPFRPGIGRMSVRLGVPVVPVHLAGMFAILPPHESWPRSGPAAVTIGPPVYPRRAAAREDPEAEARQITREVEQRIGRMDSEVRD